MQTHTNLGAAGVDEDALEVLDLELLSGSEPVFRVRRLKGRELSVVHFERSKSHDVGQPQRCALTLA